MKKHRFLNFIIDISKNKDLYNCECGIKHSPTSKIGEQIYEEFLNSDKYKKLKEIHKTWKDEIING